jgi:hypothetical protein
MKKNKSYEQSLSNKQLSEHFNALWIDLKLTIQHLTTGNLAHDQAQAINEIEELEKTRKELNKRKIK